MYSPTYRPDQRLEVCDVCGSLLANDATGVRIEAHMAGYRFLIRKATSGLLGSKETIGRAQA